MSKQQQIYVLTRNWPPAIRLAKNRPPGLETPSPQIKLSGGRDPDVLLAAGARVYLLTYDEKTRKLSLKEAT